MKKHIKELHRKTQTDRKLSLEQLDAITAGGKKAANKSCDKIVQGKKAGIGNIQLCVFNDKNFNEDGFNGNPVHPIVDFEKMRQDKSITAKWMVAPKC